MTVPHGSALKILRVFGGFIVLLYLGKLFSEPKLQAVNGASLYFHFLSILVMYICFTWTWVLELSIGKIESIWGPLGLRRKTVITGLQSVELATDVIEAQGKGDSFSLSLTVKAKIRPKGVAILTNQGHEQGEHFNKSAKDVSAALGGLPINVSDHFEKLYKHIYKKDFTL